MDDIVYEKFYTKRLCIAWLRDRRLFLSYGKKRIDDDSVFDITMIEIKVFDDFFRIEKSDTFGCWYYPDRVKKIKEFMLLMNK